jgi:hypothetical protein
MQGRLEACAYGPDVRRSDVMTSRRSWTWNVAMLSGCMWSIIQLSPSVTTARHLALLKYLSAIWRLILPSSLSCGKLSVTAIARTASRTNMAPRSEKKHGGVNYTYIYFGMWTVKHRLNSENICCHSESSSLLPLLICVPFQSGSEFLDPIG